MSSNNNLKPVRDYLQRGYPGSTWLSVNGFDLCVRLGAHAWDRKVHHTFDIVNVTLRNEKGRGRGKFTKLLADIKGLLERNPDLCGNVTHLYVENVLAMRLREGVKRMGFTPVPPGAFDLFGLGGETCFYQSLTRRPA